ncbi:hypothetical protein IFM89_030666, partial [Coptis chinensis]
NSPAAISSRQVGQFGSPPSGQFENGFYLDSRSLCIGLQSARSAHPPSYVEDLDSPIGGGGGGVVVEEEEGFDSFFPPGRLNWDSVCCVLGFEEVLLLLFC